MKVKHPKTILIQCDSILRQLEQMRGQSWHVLGGTVNTGCGPEAKRLLRDLVDSATSLPHVSDVPPVTTADVEGMKDRQTAVRYVKLIRKWAEYLAAPKPTHPVDPLVVTVADVSRCTLGQVEPKTLRNGLKPTPIEPVMNGHPNRFLYSEWVKIWPK